MSETESPVYYGPPRVKFFFPKMWGVYTSHPELIPLE